MKIAVLICTKNGSRFIVEQLESIKILIYTFQIMALLMKQFHTLKNLILPIGL